MTNSIIMIKTKSNERIEKLIIQKIKAALDCIEERITIEEKEIFAVFDNRIKMEIKSRTDNIWIINLIGYDDYKKKQLINMLNVDNLFEQSVFIFDTKSNVMMSENYKVIHDLEVKLRSEFCFKLIDNWGNEAFQLIDKINVKEETRIKTDIISNRINTKLQRLDLSKLIDYMKENIWGGDEVEKLSEMYMNIDFEEELSDEYKKLFDLKLFEDILKLIDNEKLLITTRNNICHNRLIHCDEFKKKIEQLQVVGEKINDLYFKSINSKLKIKGERDYEISIIIESDKKDVKENDIKLIFSRILNVVGYIFENKDYQIAYEDIDGKRNYIIEQDINNNIRFRLRYVYSKKKANLYLLDIIYDCDLDDEVSMGYVSELRDEILKNIKTNSILLNDTVTLYYSDKLFSRFNYIENLLRAYIATFYIINDLDLKGIDSKNNSKNDSTIVYSNNPLFDFDFIKLGDILRNTPKGYKNKEMINEFKKKIMKKDKDSIEKLEKKLINISDTNSSIIEIINVWDELYKYRTIVAHNEYISKYEYEYIMSLLEKTIEIVEKIYFDMINDSETINDEIIYKDTTSELKVSINQKDIQIKAKDNIYEFENIGISKFYRLIKSTIEKIDEFDTSFILTKMAIKDYLGVNKDKVSELVCKNGFDYKIKESIKNLKYTKYLKSRSITNREELLEERIGDLLKEVENKIIEIDDEICATLSNN